jgi:hypothetical protein
MEEQEERPKPEGFGPVVELRSFSYLLFPAFTHVKPWSSRLFRPAPFTVANSPLEGSVQRKLPLPLCRSADAGLAVAAIIDTTTTPAASRRTARLSIAPKFPSAVIVLIIALLRFALFALWLSALGTAPVFSVRPGAFLLSRRGSVTSPYPMVHPKAPSYGALLLRRGHLARRRELGGVSGGLPGGSSRYRLTRSDLARR